jgi:hypothetical protein
MNFNMQGRLFIVVFSRRSSNLTCQPHSSSPEHVVDFGRGERPPQHAASIRCPGCSQRNQKHQRNNVGFPAAQ